MLTKTIHQYIHALPTTKGLTHKKSGQPSRQPRGEEIGVMVAHVLDDKTYGLQISLVHPGVGKIKDKFDRHIALRFALGKLVLGEPLPFVVHNPNETKRSINIKKQFQAFSLQAAKVFKDKTVKL